jgi:predicted transposase YbfD/YdcC
VFRLHDPAAPARAFEAILSDLGADGVGVLAIDGKTLRRSFDRAAGRSPLHVVTAFGAQARLSVGQRAVAPGENEITAARALLATLALDGALTPERFARAVRSHWAIENSLHWVLDVTFDEDATRNRADNGPENLAILRRLTLSLLRTARPKLPVSRKRKRSGWSDAFARSVIGQMR